MLQFRIIKLDAISSTNDYLKSRASSDLCNLGDVVVAKHQTQGRGQRDKLWLVEDGQNLTFSAFWEASNFRAKDQFLLTMAVSLAVVKCLQSFKIPDLKIKWPNDIMAGNFKIGGILIENSLQGTLIENAVIGVGINVNQHSFQGIPHASSLQQQTGKSYDINHVLAICLEEFRSFFEHPDELYEPELLEAYNQHLYGMDRGVMLEIDSQRMIAKIVGVTLDGIPRLEDEKGLPISTAGKNFKFIYTKHSS